MLRFCLVLFSLTLLTGCASLIDLKSEPGQVGIALAQDSSDAATQHRMWLTVFDAPAPRRIRIYPSLEDGVGVRDWQNAFDKDRSVTPFDIAVPAAGTAHELRITINDVDVEKTLALGFCMYDAPATLANPCGADSTVSIDAQVELEMERVFYLGEETLSGAGIDAGKPRESVNIGKCEVEGCATATGDITNYCVMSPDASAPNQHQCER